MLVGAPVKVGESDARIVGLLTDGEKSLADGDLESAKEQFDKASVLGERDPRAVADLARLAAAKADVDWLRLRLLARDDPEQATAQRELEQAAQRTRKAADHAAELAPTDPAVLRSRIDALRLAGDLGGARKLVGGHLGVERTARQRARPRRARSRRDQAGLAHRRRPAPRRARHRRQPRAGSLHAGVRAGALG